MNCCHKKFLIEDFRNLKFRIFTIGYASEGESVLGVIDNGDRHLYSFVIDSFQINNNNNSTFNGTLEKIKELKISSIDAFIWTHPDTDHSTGIQELLSEADSEARAQIFLPAMLNKNLDMTDDARAGMDYLFKHYNNKRTYNMSMVVKNQPETHYDQKLTFKEHRSGREITAELYFLAPCGARLLRNTCANNSFDFNRLSIMFALRINYFDYLFCGDLMGDDVQFLDKNFLKNVSFVKIPHHGSSRTHQLPQLMKRQKVTAPIAATTTSSRYNLPEKRVIRMYQSFCESVYSTSEGAHQYGCIETDFSIRDLSCNVKLSGNAQVCV